MDGLYAYSIGRCAVGQCRLKRFVLPIRGRALALETVSYRDLEAIAGRVPLSDFEGMKGQKHFENSKWLQEGVLDHEAVVEELMRRAPPVIPFKFATIFRSRSRLQDMLKTRYAHLYDLMCHLQGRSEWGVKLFSHAERLSRTLTRSDPELRRLATNLKRGSAGRRYLLEKTHQERVDQKVQKIQQEAGERLGELLSSFSKECVFNNPTPRTFTGRSEDMVLNAALLLPEEKVDSLERMLEQWDREHQKEGFQAELIGPWPPYNFSRL